MSSADEASTFDNFQDGVFNLLGGAEGKGKKIAIGVGLVFGLIVLILVVYFIWSSYSGFGNGRNVGSGCGRYNQLQRAVNLEFPISQGEYENSEMVKQEAAGMQYASSWQPQMENVYSGFGDKVKTGVEVEQYQVKPQYPQTGLTQTVYNDNVFKTIVYDH